jgi:bla regulator protein blaR1
VITDIAALLLETALAGALAIVAVLVLRLPLRRLCGARCAYALWLLVPIAMTAVLLPAPVAPAAAALVGGPVPLAGTGVVIDEAGLDLRPWLLAAWALGVLAFATICILRQSRFRRALGRLNARPDGSWSSQSTQHGPAVIGAWRGRIVLPADFDERYTPLERELVLRHERVHVARRDLAFNLAATALRGLHWFDPLVHYAIGRFRFDQELAADAAVLAQRPDARRPYADAMLKTQLHFSPPPLGCHWQSAHPLKERIAMLKRPLPGPLRYTAGAVVALTLSLAAGWTAWASQPPRIESNQAEVAAPPPDVTQLAAPKYPADAIAERVEGIVMLRVEVDANGKALRAELDAAGSTPAIDARLVAAAREAALGWKFQPVAGAVMVPITFSLTEEDSSASLPIVAPGEVEASEPAGPMPTYRRVSAPRYPKSAIEARRSGRVLLRVLVGSDGLPQQVEVEASSGSYDLDEAARTAVRKWAFNAAYDGHKAVSTWVGVPIDFSLDRDSVSPDAPSGALEPIYIRG